jgi:hypothetical protein
MRNGMLMGSSVLLGSGMWEQPPGSGPNALGNGAQILAQYAPPSGPIVIEAQLPIYELAISSMVAANFASSNVWKPCAGTWNTNGNASVWVRDYCTNAWVPTTVWSNGTGTMAQVRSLFSYTDQVTGLSYLFAGTDDSNGFGGICRGAYSAEAPGNIVWDSTPELPLSRTNQGPRPAQLGVRVMSFAQFKDGSGNTALYATVGTELYKRIDGLNPTWNLVYAQPVAKGDVSQAGLRGLTAIGQYLYVSYEGSNWQIIQLNPNAGFAAVTQYTIKNLTLALGAGFYADYVIGPYNGIRPVAVASTYYDLIGLTILVSQWPSGTSIYQVTVNAGPGTGNVANILGQARYLVKQGSNYTLKAMAQFSGGITPMGGVRDFVVAGSNVIAVGPRRLDRGASRKRTGRVGVLGHRRQRGGVRGID